MAFQLRENSGSLFKNDKKTKDAQPDYTGKVNINGREMRLAGWIKTSGDKSFLSLKVSEFNEGETGYGAGV